MSPLTPEELAELAKLQVDPEKSAQCRKAGLISGSLPNKGRFTKGDPRAVLAGRKGAEACK